MFIDASAMAAIITDEADAPDLAARMHERRARLTSPLAIWGNHTRRRSRSPRADQ
jgi:ribonuclease VapC